MKNKQVKQMISSVEEYKRNGCLPNVYLFCFYDGDFGYWVHLWSGLFFRSVYNGVISLTANQLKSK